MEVGTSNGEKPFLLNVAALINRRSETCPGIFLLESFRERGREGEKNPGDTPVNFRHEAGKRKLEAYRDNSLLLGVQRVLRGCHGFCWN